MSSDDLTARAESWLESWPGPLRLVSGGRKEQSVPDAHNAAPDLVRDLIAEVKRLTPREITSIEELEALPVGSVVIKQRRAYTRLDPINARDILTGAIREWACGDGGFVRREHREGLVGATVLYVPEVRP